MRGPHPGGALPLIVIAVAILTACSSAPSPTASATGHAIEGGSMTVRSLTQYDCFDVHKCILAYGVNNSLFATLLALDASGKPAPYLAKSWTAAPTSIKFDLRPDATCADGTPITPTVVKNSFQRMIDIKAPNNAVNFGPGPYTVAADDTAKTFTFTTNTPYSDLIYGFTNVYPGLMSGIVCPAGLANATQLGQRALGSSGPYTLVNAGPDGVTMKLRPEFTGGPAGTTGKTVGVPSTVVVKYFGNETTAANLVLTGGLDVGSVIGPDVARLSADKTLMHRIDFTTTLTTLALNHTTGHPTADVTVRQALITAVDTKAVLAAAGGRGKLSPSILTSNTPCFDPNTSKLAPVPSVDKARQILVSAGWTLSGGKLVKNGQPLKITAVIPSQLAGGPEYLQNVWTQMGAEVTLPSVDQSLFTAALFAGNFDVSVINSSVYVPSPGFSSSKFSGPPYPTGTNYARTVDPVLDQYAAAAEAASGDASCKQWAKFQEQLWTEWHLLPLLAPEVDTFSKGVDMHLLANGNPIQPILLRRVST